MELISTTGSKGDAIDSSDEDMELRDEEPFVHSWPKWKKMTATSATPSKMNPTAPPDASTGGVVPLSYGPIPPGPYATTATSGQFAQPYWPWPMGQ